MIVFKIISLFLATECLKQAFSFQCNGSKESLAIDVYRNHCYMIGEKRRCFEDAYRLCEIYGGDLTDIPEDGLGNVTNQSKSINQYWIGVIWAVSLKKWFWITGMKKEPVVEKETDLFGTFGYFGFNCASYYVDSERSYLKETHCRTELKPICKFNLPNHPVGCYNICSNVMDAQPEVDNILSNETSAASLNETINVTMTSNRTDKVCECKEKIQLINDGIITTLTLILGAVLFVSFVMNILTVCQIVCKYRKARAKRSSSQKNRISLIDILSVGGGDLSPGDTYEKMNYDDDNTPSQGLEKVPKRANSAQNFLSDDENNCCEGLTKNDMDLKVFRTYCMEAKSLGDQSCAYSTLDHRGTNLAAVDPCRVYGIENGSVHSVLDKLRDCEVKDKLNVENTEPLDIYSNVKVNDN